MRGERVGLRAIERDDLPLLREWRNRPEYRRYFREYRELNVDHQKEWFEKTVLGDPRTVMFSIVELQTNRLLGVCGLCYIDWINQSADFSIYIGIDNTYIDRIYAPDASKTLIKFGFEELNLHRLWAEIYDFDEPKKQMFAVLNFTLDGKLRQTHWSEGAWHDSIFYSLLKTDISIDDQNSPV